MDQYLILEFQTEAEAQAALAVINQIAAQWWAAQGYTVDNGTLIGRNAASGNDEPEKQRTTTWAEITESPEGTFYFPSLSNDPRFADWRDYLPHGVTMPPDKALPDVWASQDISV